MDINGTMANTCPEEDLDNDQWSSWEDCNDENPDYIRLQRHLEMESIPIVINLIVLASLVIMYIFQYVSRLQNKIFQL